MAQYKLKTNPLFRDLIRPLSTEEYRVMGDMSLAVGISFTPFLHFSLGCYAFILRKTHYNESERKVQRKAEIHLKTF